ncbi:MAG: hypothetical protein WB643_01920 [Candidatus Bathyarchaeia archaeon]
MEQPSSKRISLKQVIGAVEINLSGDDAKSLLNDYKAILKALDEDADLLKEIYGKLSGTPLNLALQPKTTPRSDLGQMSIAEMIRKSAVKTDVDRVFLVSFYLFRGRNLDTFTRKEIDDAIAEARLKEPTNLTRTLNELIEAGKLREAGKKGTKKALTVTQTGEDKAKELLVGPRKQE